MRTIGFIIFFSIFFSVYGILNYYIFVRGLQAIPSEPVWRKAYLALFLLLALSFIAGRILERVWLSPLSDALVWIGSFWIGAMLYFLLAVVALDLLRLANHFLPLYPAWVRDNYESTKEWLAFCVAALVLVIVAAGHVNAMIPRVKILALRVHKKTDGPRSLTIAMASDIHLGTIVGRRRLDRIVEKINSLDADLVLLPGDIVDEDLGAVVRENLGASLQKIRSKYGVVAVTGNHEYIGGVEKACEYMSAHGVTMLRDAVLRINGGICLAGREDRSIRQFSRTNRKPIEELLAGVDRRYPVILLDHQPSRLQEAETNGVDLQLSGHTHHGQIWPVNYITSAIYEVSWGYKLLGQTHVYVSSGVGTWGPPIRIGNRPEIIRITLTFD